MSERDEDHAMNMPRVSPEDVEPRVANTAHDQEVTDFKPHMSHMSHNMSHHMSHKKINPDTRRWL